MSPHAEEPELKLSRIKSLDRMRGTALSQRHNGFVAAELGQFIAKIDSGQKHFENLGGHLEIALDYYDLEYGNSKHVSRAPRRGFPEGTLAYELEFRVLNIYHITDRKGSALPHHDVVAIRKLISVADNLLDHQLNNPKVEIPADVLKDAATELDPVQGWCSHLAKNPLRRVRECIQKGLFPKRLARRIEERNKTACASNPSTSI
jgi:hypothetical protein